MKIPSPIPRELILIVDPKAGLRANNGKISGIDEELVAPLRKLLFSENATIRPLYGVSEDYLKERTPETNIKMGLNQPLDLTIFYKVTSSAEKFPSLAAQLRQLK